MRLTDSKRRFSSSILKLLIENRRTTHNKRVNNNTNIVELVDNDIFMTRTDIQSNTSTNRVAK